MRLLTYANNGDLCITPDLIDDVPPYTILSHTWMADDEEVTFADLRQGNGRSKTGYRKIKFCGEQSRRDGIDHFWIDTCCIDKVNHTELSEAITSMFRWLQNAQKCYVYLADVSMRKRSYSGDIVWETGFRTSRWFTRGWTLQELIAPRVVEFFSHEGEYLGTKETLVQQIHEITTIPIAALRGAPLSEFPVAERIRWTEKRQTKKVEDQAYCLLGIFDVFMPLIYGEGDNALRRLQKEIKERYGADAATTLSIGHRKSSQADPSTSQDELFYQPLGTSNFRLFSLNPGKIGENITGFMRQDSLTNPPPYYALSYVWGHEPQIHEVVINNTARMIQPNLFNALRRFRLPRGQTTIWVDALCINQDDSSERNMQVRQMAKIYSSAEGVLIWLGEADATSQFAFEFLEEITSNRFRWDSHWWEQHGFRALTYLLERPWFRRAWVIQEVAFSRHSTLLCGHKEIYMDKFITSIRIVRDRLSTVPLCLGHALTRFHDSPAFRLTDMIMSAFKDPTKRSFTHPRLSLEALVDMSIYSETTDARDTIYALLNVANDTSSFSESHQPDIMVPDYTKSVVDVLGDFVLHSCSRSGKLDIVCRPWAPVTSIVSYRRDQSFDQCCQKYPSWIISREKLAFGNPSEQSKQRVRGDSLVGRSYLRHYNAHYRTKPQVSIGEDANGVRDGSLKARGFFLGEIAKCSVRMADAIVTKDCIDILRVACHESHPDSDDISDVVWRTLCADTSGSGGYAPQSYGAAMVYLLKKYSGCPEPTSAANLLDEMPTLDPEEILEHDIPHHVEQFIKTIRATLWNRRTFQLRRNDNADRVLVGLVPQDAKVGDKVCILYGCSVPVVLRKLIYDAEVFGWQLIGEAYVHGVMDGEAISSSSMGIVRNSEADFKIL